MGNCYVSFCSCMREQRKTYCCSRKRRRLSSRHAYYRSNYPLSDSGMIRYKIITAEWLIYSHRNPPFWAFEKGIYLEKFDSLFHVDASIKADTAYYYEPKKLWELRGNVHIQSQRGDKFDTELMFWDQDKEKIYSDKFIRIEQIDKVLTGYGFESNQQMTEYQIYNNTGIFTVEDNAVQADSTQTSK